MNISLDNSDGSEVVIEKMKALHPQSTWLVSDVLAPARDGHTIYDAIIDKCLCDAFLCGGVEADKLVRVKAYLKHCSQVTTDSGRMIIISFGQPESRMRFFQQEDGCGWNKNIKVEEVVIPLKDGRKNKCWLYEFTK